MKEIMVYKENPLTGDWLCWIPETAQAYYYPTKRQAKKFCDNVNQAFERGEIKLVGDKVIIVEK